MFRTAQVAVVEDGSLDAYRQGGVSLSGFVLCHCTCQLLMMLQGLSLDNEWMDICFLSNLCTFSSISPAFRYCSRAKLHR